MAIVVTILAGIPICVQFIHGPLAHLRRTKTEFGLKTARQPQFDKQLELSGILYDYHLQRTWKSHLTGQAFLKGVPGLSDGLDKSQASQYCANLHAS